jgi:hypothetical protein
LPAIQAPIIGFGFFFHMVSPASVQAITQHIQIAKTAN